MNKEDDLDSARCDSPRFSMKRMLQSLAWLAVTSVLYLVTLYLLKHNPQWSPGSRVAVTLAPLLPGIFYLLSILKSFRAMDELQRRIQVEAWGFALAGTVVVSTGLNVLNANGVGFADYPHGLQIGGIYMSMSILWSVGISLSNLRYR